METKNEPQNKGEREVGKTMSEQTANIAFVWSEGLGVLLKGFQKGFHFLSYTTSTALLGLGLLI